MKIFRECVCLKILIKKCDFWKIASSLIRIIDDFGKRCMMKIIERSNKQCVIRNINSRIENRGKSIAQRQFEFFVFIIVEKNNPVGIQKTHHFLIIDMKEIKWIRIFFRRDLSYYLQTNRVVYFNTLHRSYP